MKSRSNFKVKVHEVTRSKIMVWKVLSQRMHVKYESPISYDSYVMTKVKVLKKKVKLEGQGHPAKNYGMIWKAFFTGNA